MRDPRLPWRSAAALALAAAGRHRDAVALAEQAHAHAARFGVPRDHRGCPSGRWPRLGLRSERTERCRAAVAALAESEGRLEHGHALCDLGA